MHRLIVLILAVTLLSPVEGFQSLAFHRPISCQVGRGSFALNTSPIASANEATDTTVHDINGKDIKVDTVVRVAVEGLKAYQVNPKSGYGSYNDKKEFVYNAEKPYLELPKGLVGVVTRVYDVDVIGANFPVLVKFTPGQHTESGFDTPVVFTMHFLAEEVECV